MYNKNEADILEEIISDAVTKVDSLFIADDGSTDKSWDIIQACKQRFQNIEHIQREPNRNDLAQRNSLLNKIRSRYSPDNTWVQMIESDIFLLTEPREAIKTSPNNVSVTWHTLNAVRKPGTWKEVDTYPNWPESIRNIMPYVHWTEAMLYTFRPFPKLSYNSGVWRPWPWGFSAYTQAAKIMKKNEDSPLLLHCGYRGPTHFAHKYRAMGKRHTKYNTWDLTSPEAAERTVSFFNGVWNGRSFVPTRENWINFVRAR